MSSGDASHFQSLCLSRCSLIGWGGLYWNLQRDKRLAVCAVIQAPVTYMAINPSQVLVSPHPDPHPVMTHGAFHNDTHASIHSYFCRLFNAMLWANRCGIHNSSMRHRIFVRQWEHVNGDRYSERAPKQPCPVRSSNRRPQTAGQVAEDPKTGTGDLHVRVGTAHRDSPVEAVPLGGRHRCPSPDRPTDRTGRRSRPATGRPLPCRRPGTCPGPALDEALSPVQVRRRPPTQCNGGDRSHRSPLRHPSRTRPRRRRIAGPPRRSAQHQLT